MTGPRIPWWLIGGVGAALVLAGGRRGGGGGGSSPSGGGQAPNAPQLDKTAIWSLNGDWSTRCDGRLPVIPTASSGWGTTIREKMTAPLMWGWTGPNQHAAVDRYPGRVIADCETYVTAAGVKKWTGAIAELTSAAYLANRCPGVTSHGFVAPAIKNILGVFAKAGCVGIPQVYDTDRSTLDRPGGPRAFLRQCIESYQKAGFERVLPLLGLSAGKDIVAEWIDECGKLGIPFHLYSLQRLNADFCALVK